MIIYTDGGSRGNPGPASAAAIIGDKKYSKFLGIKTNNQAEYEAVILALENCEDKNILINLDSELVYKQIINQYKIKHQNMLPLYKKVINLIKDKNVRFNLVPREENKRADKLVNDCLDKI